MILFEDIQKAISRFRCGEKNDQKRIHWVKYERLCQAKGRGDLGFKDFTSFNQALIVK